ncbi:hypothetical protein B0I18_105154 [Taibaiella chishuiensis]|uniref:Uncharacterized protein n=1 Tax=Taibaiella chishuiensis TaxID=1434707 RepID=A0A2P8D2X5_9BACT|nr:hypothetical protein B0I18_105154 [Taibaiella chishuiensis]
MVEGFVNDMVQNSNHFTYDLIPLSQMRIA